MINPVTRMAERVLGRVLPSAKAEASECCGGTCGYEYRCVASTGAWQRRYCCTNCSCVKSCASWTTLNYDC